MAQISFAKYEGLGNDFIIVDERHSGSLKPSLLANDVNRLCERHLGIGADGVLTILSPPDKNHIATMHITNADGSVPEMCGNGLRCVGLWLRDTCTVQENQPFSVWTDAGSKTVIVTGNHVEIDMGIGIVGNYLARQQLSLPPSELPEKACEAVSVDMGNPHLVLELLVNEEQAKTIGAQLECHPAFKQRTNVGFIRRIGNNEIDLLVWERGAGLTQACGTGASAAVVALVNASKLPLDVPIQVNVPGGSLWVKAGNGSSQTLDKVQVTMRGPARKVFEGFCEF